MKAWNRIGVLLLLTLTFAFSASAAGVPNPAQKGPYEVGHTEFVATDASNSNRPVALYVFYPADPADINESTPGAVYDLDPYFDYLPNVTTADFEAYGFEQAFQEPPPSANKPFPLVVFSPGWGLSGLDYAYVGTRLASHGFVVAIIFHYSDWWWPWDGVDHIATTSVNRSRDMSFALTELLSRNAMSSSLLYNLIKPDRVAASGHSIGGYGAMVLASGDDEVCDSFQDPTWFQGPAPPETCIPLAPDPRFKVIVPLDGSTQVLRFYEMARIKVPTLGMGQEWSNILAAYGPGIESWQARLHAANAAHPGYRIDLNWACHLTFANWGEMLPLLLGTESLRSYFDANYPGYADFLQWYYDTYVTGWIPSTEAHRIVTQYMIAFLKTNLMGETGYQQMLTPGYALINEPNVEFFVTEKRNAQAIDEDWPGDFVYFPHQPGSAQARGPKDPSSTLPIWHPKIRQ